MLYRHGLAAITLALLCAVHLHAATLEDPRGTLRVEVHESGPASEETIFVKMRSIWVPALSAAQSSVRLKAKGETRICELQQVTPIDHGLLLKGDCGVGKYQQRILLTTEDGVLDVSTRLTLDPNASIQSVEDRYDFMPARRSTDTPEAGPLDFVWSQNIKSEADDLIPTYGFKSPAVMFQQGEVFAALIPQLSNRRVEPLALDLDVTSGMRPWMSFGQIPAHPHGHSYFRRATDGHPKVLANTIEYSYSILASRQPVKLGYRRVVRLLWAKYGHPSLLASPGLQQNVIKTELRSFDSWRKDAWLDYANRVYIGFDCGGKRCGTLASNRSVSGDWGHSQPDAWFNAWFQTLRTAYGWYLYGRNTHNADITAKAESVLTLALSAPQKDGAFPTIYLLDSKQWIADDGWAGYKNDYHSFCMSWTAYWMLRWAEDLTPARKAEVIHFVQPYAGFLLHHQQASGVIPSWYDTSTLQPRAEFRDFNAETAVSALFLAELGRITKNDAYITAAERAMNFITNEVVPRQRWYDFETFLSCARKDYSFYDRWTVQYPQNNLAEIQAPEAWLALFRATHQREYLDRGTKALDYLLLTQQVWSNPSFSPHLLGGFTTQNTDAEWSDARQSYAAIVLFDYFRETGNSEYLERAVAAARATFAIAPWENWAHTGYIDEPGSLTGFHWGTGSAMTSIEIMAPVLGDAYIDLKTGQGAGFDECSLRDIRVSNGNIAFNIDSPAKQRAFTVRFSGVNPSQQYRIAWDGGPAHEVTGSNLIANGYRIQAIQ